MRSNEGKEGEKKNGCPSTNRIEPIPCGEQQWREDDASAIIAIARRQGERVIPVA